MCGPRQAFVIETITLPQNQAPTLLLAVRWEGTPYGEVNDNVAESAP